MTDDERAFRRAICERPEENTPRLAFADWLEERDGHNACPRCGGDGTPFDVSGLPCDRCHGSGRDPAPNHYRSWADLIRDWVSTAADARHFAAGGPAEFSYPPGAGHVVVAPALPGLAYTVARGFVAGVACPLAAWLEHGPRVVAEQPVEAVTITDAIGVACGRDRDTGGMKTIYEFRQAADLEGFNPAEWHRLVKSFLPAGGTFGHHVVENEYRVRFPLVNVPLGAHALDHARRAAGLPPLAAT